MESMESVALLWRPVATSPVGIEPMTTCGECRTDVKRMWQDLQNTCSWWRRPLSDRTVVTFIHGHDATLHTWGGGGM